MSSFEPDYNLYNEIPKPMQIGLKRGGKMDYVREGGEIAAYYGDLIVAGQSSTPITKNYSQLGGKFVREFGIKPIQPYGINYFVPSGLTCHNGAEMYNYVETIPKPRKGNRGLVIGALDDVDEAADVKALTNAFLGSLYPVCVKKTLYVGTADNKIKNSKGKYIISEPGTVEMINGFAHQTRWVQAKTPLGEPITLTKEQFQRIPKSLKFNGKSVESDPKPKHKSDLLSVPPSKNSWNEDDLKEKFSQQHIPTGLYIAGILPLICMGLLKLLKK